MVIGYYVHHQGQGHLTRARVISTHLRARGHEVVLLGSGLDSGEGVVLPRDNDDTGAFEDPAVCGALHWAPLRHQGYTGRMQTLAAWVTVHRPEVVVVDVSAEVVALLRLLGVATVLVVQPGERADDGHTLAFRCATAILAPWPQEARPCPAIESFSAKVTYVGGVSGVRLAPSARSVGVVLGGQGGAGDGVVIDQVRDQVPHLQWVQAGPGHWVRDVGALLSTAQVVVTHCGQNAIADIAATKVPAVLAPQARPHREQAYLGAELTRLGFGVAAPTARATSTGGALDWAAAVDAAVARPGQWDRWGTESAAERAAALIEDVAHG
ncbi:MAG: hypothetical protein WA966_03305 [Ornithinimicrobium sp.]